jgi:hypothetical protein
VNDDFFAQYSAHMKAEAEEKKNKPQGGGGFKRDFEDLMWSGLESSKFKTFRFVGAPPAAEELNYTRKPFDSMFIISTDIKADDGKRMVLRLPLHSDNPDKDHILHRMAARVNKVEWVKVDGKDKKQKVFVNKDAHPKLFEWVEKGGFNEKDGFAYTYARGLAGQQVVIFNVIDRSDTWCADNKHTKLLSKQVKVNDDGSISFPFTGVGAYGFCVTRSGLSPLDRLISSKSGGNYEKYDIAVMRTGKKEEPYVLKNASYLKSKEAWDEIENDDGSDFDWEQVVIGPLTDAELSYERYDITKLFAPTTYQKLLKRIPQFFKDFDEAFGEHYYDELVALAEDEKEKFKEMYPEDEKSEAEADTKAEADAISSEVEASEAEDESDDSIEEEIPEETVKAPAPVRRAAPAATALDTSKVAHWDVLSDRERAQVKAINADGSFTFTDEALGTVSCTNVVDGEECGFLTPSDWQHCPKCGCSYEAA